MFGNFDTSELRFEQDEIDNALAAVKSRVRRRRGGVLLPIIVAAGVGAGAYYSLMAPMQSSRVDTIDVAAPGDTEFSDAAETTSETDPTAADEPGEPVSNETPAGSDESDKPTSPAISFDASNVITRVGPDSASTSTPPSPNAEVSGPSAGSDQVAIDSRRADNGHSSSSDEGGSDAEVGASSEADGLEGSLDASPGSSTGNPSAGTEGPGEGANPPISFEDPAVASSTDESATTPQISAVASSAATSEAAEDANAVAVRSPGATAGDQTAEIVRSSFDTEGQLVTLTLVIAAGGEPVPCGVSVNWGDGFEHALPCDPECAVPVVLVGAQELTFTHTYSAPGKAEISVGTTDEACVADPDIAVSIGLSQS